jgi:hypothetical protein
MKTGLETASVEGCRANRNEDRTRDSECGGMQSK